MPRPRKGAITLPPELAQHRDISIQEAAAIRGLHEDSFRKHYSHLIRRVGPRLQRVRLADLLASGKSKSA